jgi:hypothetical protein
VDRERNRQGNGLGEDRHAGRKRNEIAAGAEKRHGHAWNACEVNEVLELGRTEEASKRRALQSGREEIRTGTAAGEGSIPSSRLPLLDSNIGNFRNKI